jgi:O-antigen/teichoic acid export membrane protein
VNRRLAAAGGVSAQFSQAVASFVLTVAGVRFLPVSEFGVLALLLGSLVLATALMTGFVGDSLTVLDRRSPPIRAALEFWCLAIAGGLVIVGTALTLAPGLLDGGQALLFGLALAAFTLEDTARRLLMANLRFWSVVTVDLSALAVSTGFLVAMHVRRGHLELVDFLVALALGQLVATVVGVALLPAVERRLVRWRQPALATVGRFGGWRALQQVIRPGGLTIMRLIVVAAAGRAALGQLEAARVYMSPALLVVQGMGGFLLATYAADRHLSRAEAVRATDRTVGLLVASSLGLGVLAVVLVPELGPLVAGTQVHIDPVAVAGWATFTMAAAATMPYASLGAVRGRQSLVVGLRLVDTGASLAFVVVLLSVLALPPALAPFGLALGGFIGAALQRWVALAEHRVVPVPAGVDVSY